MGKSKDKDKKKESQTPSNDRADYPVGYKKPPQHTQFKSGQSGNLNGRPKKLASVTDTVTKHLKRIVLVTIGGKTQRMSMLDAIAMTLIGQAAKGDHKSASLVFNQLKPGEGIQNNNLPDLIQQFRTVNASRKTADGVLNISVEPDRNLTTPTHMPARNKKSDKDDEEES